MLDHDKQNLVVNTICHFAEMTHAANSSAAAQHESAALEAQRPSVLFRPAADQHHRHPGILSSSTGPVGAVGKVSVGRNESQAGAASRRQRGCYSRRKSAATSDPNVRHPAWHLSRRSSPGRAREGRCVMMEEALKWIGAFAVSAFILGGLEVIDFDFCIKPAGQCSLR